MKIIFDNETEKKIFYNEILNGLSMEEYTDITMEVRDNTLIFYVKSAKDTRIFRVRK